MRGPIYCATQRLSFDIPSMRNISDAQRAQLQRRQVSNARSAVCLLISALSVIVEQRMQRRPQLCADTFLATFAHQQLPRQWQKQIAPMLWQPQSLQIQTRFSTARSVISPPQKINLLQLLAAPKKACEAIRYQPFVSFNCAAMKLNQRLPVLLSLV